MKRSYPIILAELSQRPWGMLPSAFETLLSILQGTHELSKADIPIFHNSEGLDFLVQREKMESKASLLFGKPMEGKQYSSSQDGIGFLFVEGPLVPRGGDLFTDISGLTTVDKLIQEFKALDNNPNISQIAIIGDSPGGDITSIGDFAYTISNASKPVKSFGWMLASAMYWIAAAAKEVWIPPSGIAGSVGTVVTVYLPNGNQNKIEIVSSQSPKKRTDVTTEEGKAVRQKIVDDLTEAFLSDIEKFRGISRDDIVSKWEGNIFVGQSALEMGLVNNIGTVDEFLASFKNGSEETNRAKKGISMGTNTLKTDELETHQNASELAQLEQKTIERIRSIESLADKFKGSVPGVYAAVKAKIDEIKYQSDMTAEKAAAILLDVVSGARLDSSNSHSVPRIEAGNLAKKTGSSEPPDGDDLEEQQFKALCAVRSKSKEVLKNG